MSFVIQLAGLAALATMAAAQAKLAYNYPDSPAYPAPSAWAALNTSVPGQLFSCATWNHPACGDVSLRATHVLLARSEEHIAPAVAFASKHNIRVSVRNTGHDFMARHSAAGGLTVVTGGMKGATPVDVWVPSAGGEAFKQAEKARGQQAVIIEAGMMWAEVLRVLSGKGRAAVHGADPSVGASGGWTLGGGHGPYVNLHGLGCDNALEFTVVLTNGTILTANADSHPDLFFALRGGGGGTFGIVTRTVMKTFNQPSMPTAMLTVSYGDKGRDGYLDAMAYFFAQTPKMNDFGVTGYPVMSETSYGGSLTGPGKTEDEVRAFVTPMVERMRALGAKVSMTLGSRLGGMSKGDLGALAGLFGGAKGAGMGGLPKGDLSALAGLFGGAKGAAAPRNSATLFYGPDGSIRVPDVLGALHRHRKRQAVDMSPVHQTPVASMASRLLARSALSEENIPAIRAMLANVTGFLLPYGNLGGQVSKNKALDVGVNPAWREASMHLNEAADVQEKDWKRTFWGPKEHYARLLEVKKKYDPTNTLWCFPCVGADVFAQKEGRLYVS